MGAAKVLKNFFKNSQDAQTVIDILANQGIQWHFIPPAAPPFWRIVGGDRQVSKTSSFKGYQGRLTKFRGDKYPAMQN